MRSNIARTWVSSRVPERAAEEAAPLVMVRPLLQVREEDNEVVVLLRREILVGRHRRGRVDQGARDRLPRQSAADLRQVRARAVVAVLSELVARGAPRLRGDEPA